MNTASFVTGFITALILFGEPFYLSLIVEEVKGLNQAVYNLLKVRKGDDEDDEDMFDEQQAPENEPQLARVKTASPDYIN